MKADIFLNDLKYTIRSLSHDRGFTLVAMLILALGIGANVAVFSVVNTLLLRPLPFPNAQQLTWIAPPPTKCGLSCATYSTDAYDEFRTYTRSYQDVTGYFAFSSADNLSLTLNGGAPITATASSGRRTHKMARLPWWCFPTRGGVASSTPIQTSWARLST